jgi:hypothetical protein
MISCNLVVSFLMCTLPLLLRSSEVSSGRYRNIVNMDKKLDYVFNYKKSTLYEVVDTNLKL